MDKQNIIDSLRNFRTLLVGRGTEIEEAAVYVSQDQEAHMSLDDMVQRSRVYYPGEIHQAAFRGALNCIREMIDLRQQAKLTHDHSVFTKAIAKRDEGKASIDKLLRMLSQPEKVQAMFSEIMNDEVTVKTADGKMYTNIAASVQRNKVFTERTDIPIRRGDQIVRTTPAGVEEVFVVEDPGFHSGFEDFPATYQMLVRPAAPPPPKRIADALRLLEAICEHTHHKEEPIFVEEIRNEIELFQQEAEAAWRYLRDRQLIDTFGINYAARINANGIDVIETARSHPDEPAKFFPSVTYNYINVHTMINSAIQQGGAHATMTQTVSYSRQDIDDLHRLVDVFENHLDDLALDATAKRRARAQVETIRAQLEDEPDPAIIRQAGRTLRNITEGAIAGLIAAAVQPIVWAWAAPILARLFAGP